nr:MAG TPA: hypothetical protein [Caudoviricetes sp.]
MSKLLVTGVTNKLVLTQRSASIVISNGVTN